MCTIVSKDVDKSGAEVKSILNQLIIHAANKLSKWSGHNGNLRNFGGGLDFKSRVYDKKNG